MVPSLLRKNQGDCPKMLLQLVASVKGLVWIATFFHFAQGIQGGVVFEGKLAFPTLMLLALLLQVPTIRAAQNFLRDFGYKFGQWV